MNETITENKFQKYIIRNAHIWTYHINTEDTDPDLKYSIFISACLIKSFIVCYHDVIKHPVENIMYSTIIKYLKCLGKNKNVERLVNTCHKCKILNIPTNHTYVPFVKLKCYHGSTLIRIQWLPVHISLILIMVTSQKKHFGLVHNGIGHIFS